MGGKRRLLSAVTARCRSWRQRHPPGRRSAAEGPRGHTTATGGNGGKAAASETAETPHLGEARGPSPRTSASEAESSHLRERGRRVPAPRRSEAGECTHLGGRRRNRKDSRGERLP